MPEHILFLTGRLAEKSLRRVLWDMQPCEFSYEVRELGIHVAGLMTSEMIRRRIPDRPGADRILVPGRCRGDLDLLAAHYGIPVERGPDELKDLPQFFGKGGKAADLSHYDIKIFAEIVDAPRMTIEAVLERAHRFRRDGADVIDIGCLPQTPFEQLGQMVRALKAAGFAVSVDSVDPQELLCAGRSGADYLLSLNEDTLWVADAVAATPVLIPSSPGDLQSLYRAMKVLNDRGRDFYADPILDPIHFGFSESISRFVELRRAWPCARIMMGIGNVTELTDADTSGINAILLGLASELSVSAVLTTEVSPHARRAVREADAARRMMYASRRDNSLPRGYTSELLTVHGRNPFPDRPDEIAEMARAIKDPSFRVQVSSEGLHVYNRDGHHRATDPFDIWPMLGLQNDGGHAFYMGVETARAQIAWQLGKRYAQDEEIDWGCAVDRGVDDKRQQSAPGTTLEGRPMRHKRP